LYYLVNKELVRKLGVIPSLTLSLLIDKYKYFKKENKLDSQGGFFLSAKKTKKQINIIEQELKIARSARRTAFDVLKKNNLAKIIKKGNPAQYHYYLNFKSILNILSSEDELTPLSQGDVNPSSEVESSPLYNKNKEQKQINNAEKLTSSKFQEYKNRLRAIDEKFGLSYLESSKANQYYEQAQIKFEQNNDRHFSEFFESILAKLEKLTSQKLDRFAFKQGFTISLL
jgi:selenocysteine-specific translation elongation factor